MVIELPPKTQIIYKQT